MEERQRQLLITEMLSRAFNICKDNILEILKAVGIFMITAWLLSMITSLTSIATTFFSIFDINSYVYYDKIPLEMNSGIILLITIIGIFSGILSLFGELVITKILDDANKGNEVSWKKATKYIWKKKWSALGLNILVFLIIFIAIVGISFLAILLSLLTLGIGAIILVPLVIAIVIVIIPITSLFNSNFVVNDLGAIDSIKETFLLFRKGYFWSTVGKVAAISGISIGLGIILLWIKFIPILGFILSLVVQVIIDIYLSAYLNVFVLDRTKSQFYNFKDNSGDDNQENGFIDPII